MSEGKPATECGSVSISRLSDGAAARAAAARSGWLTLVLDAPDTTVFVDGTPSASECAIDEPEDSDSRFADTPVGAVPVSVEMARPVVETGPGAVLAPAGDDGSTLLSAAVARSTPPDCGPQVVRAAAPWAAARHEGSAAWVACAVTIPRDKKAAVTATTRSTEIANAARKAGAPQTGIRLVEYLTPRIRKIYQRAAAGIHRRVSPPGFVRQITMKRAIELRSQ